LHSISTWEVKRTFQVVRWPAGASIPVGGGDRSGGRACGGIELKSDLGEGKIFLSCRRGPLPHARLRGFRAASRAHAHHLSARADSGHSVLPGPRHAAWARPPTTYLLSFCRRQVVGENKTLADRHRERKQSYSTTPCDCVLQYA
jgi:hypothetical protein